MATTVVPRLVPRCRGEGEFFNILAIIDGCWYCDFEHDCYNWKQTIILLVLWQHYRHVYTLGRYYYS